MHADELAEADDAFGVEHGPESRRAAPHCHSCRTKTGPLIYFQNGNDYCEVCASAVHRVTGPESAGRRESDPEYPKATVSAD
jgi:hypothetical protein